jgi:hypothetical protein
MRRNLAASEAARGGIEQKQVGESAADVYADDEA